MLNGKFEQQDNRFSAIIDNFPGGISMIDTELRLVAHNHQFRKLLDFPDHLFEKPDLGLEEIFRFNANRGEYGPGDVEQQVRERVDRARKFEPHKFERVRPDGTVLEIQGALVPGGGFVTIYLDITQRKRAEEALRESAREMRLFADNVPDMTASFDKNLNLLGKHLREVVGEHAFGEIEGYFQQALDGHPVTYQRAGRLANNEMGHLQIKLMPNIREDGSVLGCFSVTTDITEHKQVEEQIRQVAHHDSLTGLPNRLLFSDRLGHAISMAKRDSRQFALLYLDLDKFKPVNDTLGHAAGDELLRAAAQRIRGHVRESDTVARIGGDEFAVILPSISTYEEARAVTDKVAASMATPFQLESHQQSARIGVSVGIAIYPTDGYDADALFRAADSAMYRVKQGGISCRQ
jgi:diguanylate cyclase (GGDEF)-like protein